MDNHPVVQNLKSRFRQWLEVHAKTVRGEFPGVEVEVWSWGTPADWHNIGIDCLIADVPLDRAEALRCNGDLGASIRHTEPALLVINPHFRLIRLPNSRALQAILTLVGIQFHILFLCVPLLFSFGFLFSPFAVALTLIANQKQLSAPLQATRPSQFIA